MDAPQAAEDWTPPEIIDEFHLSGPLGRGAMGQVYLGHDTVLDRAVAVKFIAAARPDETLRQRFFTEARAIARLQHPNVVTIYRVGEVAGRPYLVSELVQGQSLDYTPKPVPWRQALRIGLQLARGLGAAHRQGVLHRDIKPANVMMQPDGEVKILDFGVAKLSDALQADSPQAEDSYAGTPLYMAPEVLAGGPASPQSEIYAIGSVLYELCTGYAPRALGNDAYLGIETMPGTGRALGLGDADTTCGADTYLDPGPAERAPRAASSGEPGGAPRLSLPPLVSSTCGAGGAPRLSLAPALSSPSTMRGAPRLSLPPVAGASGERGSGPRPSLAPVASVSGEAPGAPRLSLAPAPGAARDSICTPRLSLPPAHARRSLPGDAPTATSWTAPRPDSRTLVERSGPPPLAAWLPAADPRFCTIVDRCLADDPADRFASAEELWDALEALRAGPAQLPLPPGNPYRGLRPFEAADQGLFFGRSSEARVLLERLRVEPMIIVAGDSGVGKSSLCRAAVAPQVEAGALAAGGTGGDAPRWTVRRLQPGRRPLLSLCAALSADLGLPEDLLASRVLEQPAALGRLLRQRPGEAMLLFIDQAEELFTESDPEEVAQLAAVLPPLLVPSQSLRLLVCVRGDFLARLLALPGLGAEVSRALYLLRPPAEEALREAVIGPARQLGVRFDSEEMVEELVRQAVGTAGGLPLLQFALAELWEKRDAAQGLIPAAALQELGGVAGALCRHADEVIAHMPPALRPTARRLLCRLVGEGGVRVRRTRGELGLSAGDEQALEALVQGRLLLACEGEQETAYEIAHDSLLRDWDALRAWLDAGAETRVARQRIEAAAAEWERLGRSPEALFGARLLAEVAAVREEDLWPREAAFLRASRNAARRARLLRLGLFVAMAVVCVGVYGGVRLREELALSRAVGAHLQEAGAALAEARGHDRTAVGRRAAALALLDGARERRGEAEGPWSEALGAEELADESFVRASQELEAALIRDGRRRDVRDWLAALTFERILFSERRGRPAQVAELARRLETYDESGSWRAQLHAPAVLKVRSRPPGAAARLERYVRGPDGRLGVTRAAPQSPSSFSVPAGSYLLTLSLPGHAEARLPILLGRGETRELELGLPPAGAVPPGYVYVPPGGTLFGCGDDEDLRRGFLNAQPLHRHDTPAYLIGRTEVTFAEWIEFLRALPPEERARRTPAVRSKMTGQLELHEGTGGEYWFSIQPTSEIYRAREGEPVRYRERDRRAAQDWRRFPVSGVSLEDAEAYLAWLDRTGRLRGARLCSELEWERAARGADGRRFPHGDRLAPDDANYSETYGRRQRAFGPDEVGAHPASVSPFGVHDMAGNVWEMTRSIDTDGQIVLRGGGWYFEQLTSRAMNREIGQTTAMRDMLVGIRVCANVMDY